MITIKPAAEADAPAVQQVKDAVWPDDHTPEAHIRQVLAQPDHRTFLAEVDGTPAGLVDGFLTLSPDSMRRWEVDLLAVHPEYRGRGLAVALITASVQAGRDMGVEHVRGLIHITNTASQKAFARCGFVCDPRTHALYVSDGGVPDMETSIEGMHLIPVSTLNYRGVWVEGVLSPVAFHRAQAVRARYQWDVAGAVIPQDDRLAVEAAEAAGYARVGEYQWWRLG